MKEEFINKWSNWWILQPERKQLDEAFAKELNELIEREVALRKTNVMRWVAVTDQLPEHLQTVFITNGKGWTTLGCRVVTNEGWFWAETNGVIYESNGEIISECEIEDLDVVFWHELPKPPFV